jgi:hypothetical protein
MATRPSKLLIKPIPMVEMPLQASAPGEDTGRRNHTQNTMISESHVEGASFVRIRFDGTSNKMYGMKKTNRAIL